VVHEPQDLAAMRFGNGVKDAIEHKFMLADAYESDRLREAAAAIQVRAAPPGRRSTSIY
jgi:hypothetical protein